MNTHDIDFKLPPLPEPLCNLPTYCQDAIKQYTRSVLDAAIKADRKRRGEPVGEIYCRIYHDTEQHRDYLKARFHPDTWKNRVSFEWQGHRWAYRYTHFDDSGEYDLIVRTAPQPAEPSGGEPVSLTLGQKAVAAELLECFKAWEPMVCVLGNVRARDGADLMKSILNAYPQPAEPAQKECSKDAERSESEGWRLVPKVPTHEMIVAFVEQWYCHRQSIDDPQMDDAYQAMLAAAPEPPCET